MYRIKELLDEVPGAKSELAREMNVHPSNVTNCLKTDTLTLNIQNRYTKSFNNIFETEHKRTELFETVQ